MVNYKLCIKEGKKFKEIVWNKERYAYLNNHALKDIDDFTSSFLDEVTLKQELIRINALDQDYLTKHLSIRYNIKGHISLMQYGLMFKKDKKFLDPIFIKGYLKVMRKDVILLEKLCNHYRNSYINGRNINNIRTYLNHLLNKEITECDIQEINKVIDDFVNKEVYKYDSSTFTYKVDSTGNKLINYKNLHELAMFLSYDNNIRLEQLKIYKEQATNKVKVKKKDQIPGQYSLFD